MPRPTPASSPRTARPVVAAAAPSDAESSIRFSARNLAFLAAGLLSIVAGYMLLAGGSIVGAPLLLVLGYAVLIPLGIIG